MSSFALKDLGRFLVINAELMDIDRLAGEARLSVAASGCYRRAGGSFHFLYQLVRTASGVEAYMIMKAIFWEAWESRFFLRAPLTQLQSR